MNSKKLLLSAALVSASLPALAQVEETEEKTLETVFITGFLPETTEDLTISVTVLDDEDLSLRNAPYLADQLRAAPGVGVSRSGSFGGLTQVRIRGAEANHTLVLLDGIEISDPLSGETDFGLVSGLSAQRIEIARGEQSAFYGSDAIGGVVNVVSDDPEGVNAGIEAGSFSTARFNGGFGRAFDNSGFNIAASAFSTDGVDTSGLGGEKDGSQALSIMATGQTLITPGWSIDGLVRFSDTKSDFDADTDFDGRLNDVDRVSESQQFSFGGALQGRAFNLDHLLRASYNEVVRESLADGIFTGETEGKRTKLSYIPSTQLETTNGVFEFAGLIDWESEEYERRAPASPFGDSNQNQSFDTLGIAAEVRADFGPLALNGSARYDDNDGRFDDATTWRVGAVYGVGDAGRLRASAGVGVKNPTFTELFGFFPASFIGNPNLKPEQSTSWEIGWDGKTGPLNYSLTYFEAKLKDEIFTQFNSDFTSSPANRSGDSERSGLEAEFAYAISETIEVRSSVSNITSENETGIDEIRVPEWTGSFALNWRSAAKKGLQAGLAADYVGTQNDTDFGTFTAVDLDPYWLVSATLAYPLTDQMSLTLRADNLLDETVTDVFGYEGPGVGGYIGLRFRQ